MRTIINPTGYQLTEKEYNLASFIAVENGEMWLRLQNGVEFFLEKNYNYSGWKEMTERIFGGNMDKCLFTEDEIIIDDVSMDCRTYTISDIKKAYPDFNHLCIRSFNEGELYWY